MPWLFASALSGWLGVGGFVALALCGIGLTPWIWRLSDPEKQQRFRLGAPFGGASGRWARSVPVFFIGGLLFGLMGLLGVLGDPENLGKAGSFVLTVGVVLVVLFVITLFVWASVFLYGRPTRFVPPWLRNDPTGRLVDDRGAQCPVALDCASVLE
jgi:hypothetical protein